MEFSFLDFFAGCVGGCSGILVGHPFDTVKVRLQLQTAKNIIYKGTFHCFSSIARQESVFGLYKGMASPLVGQALINTVLFGIQGNLQRHLQDPDSIKSQYIAGCIAGAAQSLIAGPAELAKTRMQMQGLGVSRKQFHSETKAYTGPIDCLYKIYKTEGLRRGFLRGTWITIVRDTPSFGAYFVVFELICRGAKNLDPAQKEVGAPILLFAGGMAGTIAWLVIYPIDVVKSRWQADIGHKYSGLIDCTVKSYREEGPMVFTRGVIATILRGFPVNAVTFATVTLILRFAHREL